MIDGDRDTRLDVARGLAITAIVVGHVGRGLVDSGVLNMTTYAPWDRALYMSHLSVFVLVSGLLTPDGVRRRGVRSYVLPRVRLFLYLYVLWSLIQGAVRVVMADSTNTQLTWHDVLQLWIPRGQMWFLPFMAAATVLVGVAQPWRPGRRWVAGVAIILSLLLWGREGTWVFTQGWPLFGALFGGAALGARGLSWLDGRQRPFAVGVLSASALAGYVLLLTTPGAPPTYGSPGWSSIEVGLGAVASATGVVLILAVSAILAPTRFGAAIALLGRRSMAIFLAHILAASGTRVILSTAGVEDAAVHLVLGSTAGILLPLLLVAVTRRPTLAWVFDDKAVVSRLSAIVVASSAARR